MIPEEIKFKDVDFSRPGTFTVRLNSAQAKEWLRYNTGNRRVRRTLVEYIKKQIAGGEWQDGHPQPMMFSAERFIDGQHRLIAIAESDLVNGSGVLVRVETGVRDSLRAYLDTGIIRTLDDRLSLHPDPAVNKLACQLVSADMDIHNKTGLLSKFGKATPEDAQEFFRRHEEAILWVASVNQRDRGVGIMAVALAAMEYYERLPRMADEFYVDLFRPAGEVQQAQMLRDTLQKTSKLSGSSVFRRDFHGKAVSACDTTVKARKSNRFVLEPGSSLRF